MCNVGVRQGENVSPLLFAYYVNDIEERLFEVGCSYLDSSDELGSSYLKLLVMMYADDTVVLCESEKQIRKSRLALNAYCSDEVNCNKTVRVK